MAVPKRKHSKARGRKRRTHWKMKDTPTMEICKNTSAIHLRHRAYYVDGILYYKGKIHQTNQ